MATIVKQKSMPSNISYSSISKYTKKEKKNDMHMMTTYNNAREYVLAINGIALHGWLSHGT